MEQLLEHPDTLLSDMRDGAIIVVTQGDEPVFMAVPMGARLDGQGVRLELAMALFDREQVSIGVASRIAGLSISEMIDELGRRRMPVARYSGDEFAEEMEFVRSLVARAQALPQACALSPPHPCIQAGKPRQG